MPDTRLAISGSGSVGKQPALFVADQSSSARVGGAVFVCRGRLLSL